MKTVDEKRKAFITLVLNEFLRLEIEKRNKSITITLEQNEN